MRKIFFLVLLISFRLYAAPSAEVLFNTNSFIVKVHAVDKQGNHGVGSGVVVAKDYIVTNCHVIGNARGIHITKFGVSYPPQALIANWENDLCILKFKYLGLKPVLLGNSQGLNYEADVFTKSYSGNSIRPSSSFGSIKGMFNFNGYKVIQSSAFFSLGASGGGIFDENGELLGIITFKTPSRKAFYYSMPVEMIKDMLRDGAEVTITTQVEPPFWDTPVENQPFFMQVVDPIKQESWGKLKEISKKWLIKEPKADESNFHLALAQYNLGEIKQAKKIFKKVIKQNIKHVLSYLYLYKIAKQENLESEMKKLRTLILNLDKTLIEEMK